MMKRTFLVAAPLVLAGSDENDWLTGAWEIMTVPTERVPVSGQLITSGAPATGTISGATNTALNRNIQRSMIVGYLTSFNYEGAILKHGIY